MLIRSGMCGKGKTLHLTPGLAAGREFEKLKMNNIMQINSDIQLKLQGQALLAANPLLYAVFCEAAEHSLNLKQL